MESHKEKRQALMDLTNQPEWNETQHGKWIEFDPSKSPTIANYFQSENPPNYRFIFSAVETLIAKMEGLGDETAAISLNCWPIFQSHQPECPAVNIVIISSRSVCYLSFVVCRSSFSAVLVFCKFTPDSSQRSNGGHFEWIFNLTGWNGNLEMAPVTSWIRVNLISFRIRGNNCFLLKETGFPRNKAHLFFFFFFWLKEKQILGSTKFCKCCFFWKQQKFFT